MIDLYYWPTPNGWKISIMLEECGLEYRLIPVNIGRELGRELRQEKPDDEARSHLFGQTAESTAKAAQQTR
jgi:hypothetical protein